MGQIAFFVNSRRDFPTFVSQSRCYTSTREHAEGCHVRLAIVTRISLATGVARSTTLSYILSCMEFSQGYYIDIGLKITLLKFENAGSREPVFI